MGNHLTFKAPAFPFVYQTNLTSVSILVPLIVNTVARSDPTRYRRLTEQCSVQHPG